MGVEKIPEEFCVVLFFIFPVFLKPKLGDVVDGGVATDVVSHG